MKIGLIGYGGIGKEVANYLMSQSSESATLCGILVRDPSKVATYVPSNVMLTSNPDSFFCMGHDVVIEAAGHEAVRQYGYRTLSCGAHLILVSAGALADESLHKDLESAASKSMKQIIIPSAAIGGLDRIRAASYNEIEEIKLITRKPPAVWRNSFVEEKVNLDTITEPQCIFEGSAREASLLFPESVNVSAALSLAGIGFEKTKVQVYVDPMVNQNTHEIVAKGLFGQINVQVQNTPLIENPKSSHIVSMSIFKAINNLTSPMVLGV
ncbi:aspartate dehydrogenase [Pseudalkalibacillus decolorationis]|uniref:aspartate dehydrogenase n=1 Tax=Pseudalkalibacillus decolorationis TaxID=163879 RepID=UPI0021497764|nr:aspartate dehydrogenase [Pseudalkalibacillus decolorationis]